MLSQPWPSMPIMPNMPRPPSIHSSLSPLRKPPAAVLPYLLA